MKDYKRIIKREAQKLVEPGVDVQENMSGALPTNLAKLEQAYEIFESMGRYHAMNFGDYLKKHYPKEMEYLTGPSKVKNYHYPTHQEAEKMIEQIKKNKEKFVD